MTEQTLTPRPPSDAGGRQDSRPPVQPREPAATRAGAWRELTRRPRVAFPGLLVVLFCAAAAVPAPFAGLFGHGDPHACRLADSGRPPSPGHPFGHDIQGCDLYTNVVYGARPSITIAVLVTAGTLLIAVVLGSLAGFFRNWVDTLVSRVMDVFFGFPYLVGMIVVLQTLESHNVVTVSAVLTLFGWPALTRVMRSSVLATCSQDYIAAARSIGAGPWRLITRHVVPNSVGPAVVLASLSVGAVIAAEAALTFLGVGLQTPAISWGVQLNTAQQHYMTDPHLLFFPAAVLSVAVFAFVLLGDALRDAMDVRLR